MWPGRSSADRLFSGHSEPSYTSDIKVDLLNGSGIVDGQYKVNARCHSCNKWNGGSLDLTSTNASWIFAFGPELTIQDDSLTAPLRRHESYGRRPGALTPRR